MLAKEEVIKLLEEAIRVREKAFAIKSGHMVGASVLTEDGTIVVGCNVESFISGLGTCAERAAIDNAVSMGKYKFKAIAVVDKSSGSYPCGVCLEYLNQFSMVNDYDLEIVVGQIDGKYEIYKLSDLLPKAFKNISEKTKEGLKAFATK